MGPDRELNLSGDFWDYDYKDRIELQSAQQIVGAIPRDRRQFRRCYPWIPPRVRSPG